MKGQNWNITELDKAKLLKVITQINKSKYMQKKGLKMFGLFAIT